MSQTIKIKRSTATAAPSSLAQGELAYSDNSDKLFIGSATDGTILTVGGKLYTDLFSIGSDVTFSSGAGKIAIAPASGTLDIDAGTVDVSTQATEFSLIDNSATALTFTEGANNYLTLDTTNGVERVVLNKQVKIGDPDQSPNNEYTLPTQDGTVGQALITDGSGTVSFTTISTSLDIGGDSGTDTVSLVTDTLQFTGGEGIDTAITNNTVTITAEDASDVNKGVASFNSTHFTVTAGAVAANDITITAEDSSTASATIGEGFTFTGGEGIDTTASGTTITITGEDASDVNKGVASFDATDFTVTTGNVVVNATTLGTSTLNPGETTTTLAGLQQLDVDNIRVDTNTISSTNTNGDITLSPNGEGVIQVPAGYKDRANFGSNSLVSKSYVDAVQQGLEVKDSVRVATTGNLSATYNNGAGTLTNSGALAALGIDGVSPLTVNDRVLVKDQSNGVQNGIYDVTTVGDGSTAWVLTRSADADEPAELTGGSFTFVEEGTDNSDNGYVFTHNGTPTFGTTDLTVSQFSGAGQVTAGAGLTKTANTIDLNDDNITLEISSDIVRIKGITATDVGDILLGAASNAGYTRLVKPSAGTVTASDFLLSMDTSGNATWGNVLDGGTF